MLGATPIFSERVQQIVLAVLMFLLFTMSLGVAHTWGVLNHVPTNDQVISATRVSIDGVEMTLPGNWVESAPAIDRRSEDRVVTGFEQAYFYEDNARRSRRLELVTIQFPDGADPAQVIRELALRIARQHPNGTFERSNTFSDMGGRKIEGDYVLFDTDDQAFHQHRMLLLTRDGREYRLIHLSDVVFRTEDANTIIGENDQLPSKITLSVEFEDTIETENTPESVDEVSP